MKIGNPADKPAPLGAGTGTHASTSAPTATNANATAAATSAIPAQADASAKIQLSSTASTLRTADATPEFDAEKVAHISRSITEGKFKINPEAIADKLISNAQELLSKTQS